MPKFTIDNFAVDASKPKYSAKRRGRKSAFTDALSALAPGQSFFVASSDMAELSARSAAHQWARRNGVTVSCTKQDGGIRVSRIE